ncbi:SDR family oxidoreductase [Streptomyces galbus]|uniref:SDR family oxidoreductase n=1 Tax=Streptomyces galbus TaxID=33898 RepID=A0A4U5X414_STRGB|nr:SDR family oxidoreductase [Streptomyces galbus]TKT09845.1 SDR family oxidoreductase [Streptomyces galbus]GHD32373.1 putative NAD-dependent epimerase/dehydratase [Streptomyces galbus]
MRVFVTGATGFIGSAVVRELLDAGHRVVGLARSDRSEASLKEAGAEALRGDLADLDALRRGAAEADGVVHLAFIHDFQNYPAAAEADRRAIETMAAELAGSDRPLVATSGTLLVAPGRLATERDVPSGQGRALPRKSEETALSFVERGVRASVVRLSPTVHGRGDHGFVPQVIEVARAKGVSAYPGDGSQRWSAVHRLDAARLFRLALEKAPAGSRLHGVDEEGVPVRAIAETVGRHLGVPVRSLPADQAEQHFGWLAPFLSVDGPASGALTRELLDWHPEQPGLLADLDEGHYFGA